MISSIQNFFSSIFEFPSYVWGQVKYTNEKVGSVFSRVKQEWFLRSKKPTCSHKWEIYYRDTPLPKIVELIKEKDSSKDCEVLKTSVNDAGSITDCFFEKGFIKLNIKGKYDKDIKGKQDEGYNDYLISHRGIDEKMQELLQQMPLVRNNGRVKFFKPAYFTLHDKSWKNSRVFEYEGELVGADLSWSKTRILPIKLSQNVATEEFLSKPDNFKARVKEDGERPVIFLEKATSILHSKLSLSETKWAVTLIDDFEPRCDPLSWGGHAKIIIEGMKDEDYIIYALDFGPGAGVRVFPNIDLPEKEGESELSQEDVLSYFKNLLKTKKIRLSEGHMIDSSLVQTMLDSAIAERANNIENFDWLRNNCVIWAKKKLERIGITLESFDHGLIITSTPRQYTKPIQKSGCLIS